MNDFPAKFMMFPKVFLISLLLFCKTVGKDDTSRYNVYLIHSQEEEFYWNFEIRNAIRNYFDSSFGQIDITIIPINYPHINESILADPQFNFFRYVKQPPKPDLLVTIDRLSYEFTIKNRNRFFINTPLVFTGIADYDSSLISGQKNLSGIVEAVDFDHLLNMVIRLHPERKNFIVILDSTEISKTNKKLLSKKIPEFREHTFFILDNSNESFLKDIKKLESSSIILLLGTLRTSFGSLLTYPKTAAFLSQKIKSPIYSLNNHGISYGVLGCKLNKKHSQGIQTAELIKSILNGKKIDEIPVKIYHSERYMFDYRMMEKYNVDQKLLPQDSYIIRRPESLFAKYGIYIIIVLCIIFSLIIIIIFMIINFRRRTRAEEALHISESRLKLALNATNDGIWDWDIVKGKVYFSPRWLQILGYSEDQVDGDMRSWQKLIHTEDLDAVLSAINSHLKGETISYEAEYRMATKIEEWKWILDRGKIIEWDSNNKPTRMIGTHQDITQRKNFEVQLQESERKFRSIVESSTDGIALTDEKGILIQWNKGLERLTGISKDEAIGKFQWDIQTQLISDDVSYAYTETFKDEIISTLDGGKTPLLNQLREIEIMCKDSDKKIAQQIIFPVRTKSGFMAGSIIRDITEFKKTEAALIESEKKFRELADMLPQTIFEADLNGYLTFANRIAYEQFGFSKGEDISGLHIMNCVIPADHRRAKINFSRALRNEKFVEEYNALRKDGTTFPVLIHSTAISNNNQVIGLRGIIIDITERKRNEEAVIESEAKYRTLIETQSEGVILLDLNENITFSNPSANTIFGLSDDSLVGKNLKDFTSEEQFRKLITYSEERLSGEKTIFELEIIRKDNSIGCIHFTVSPYRNRTGEIIGGFAVFTDITQRKKSETDLIEAKEEAERSNKLKTEFLAQVSHEIRTPINSILSFTSLLKEELEDRIPDDLRSSFRIIENGGRRLIRTIDLILNMSQIQTGTYERHIIRLDLEKDILDGVILEFLPSIREKKLEFSFCNEGVDKKIFADQYTIIQIFTNLIDNAIKYTPAGRIDIGMSYYNSEIVVEISDTGIGISKEYLPHLFTAFSQEESGYTRRFDGNGLGLALVKKYCELNNARIEVVSRKGKGSTFRVFFPAI